MTNSVPMVAWSQADMTPERVERWKNLTVEEIRALRDEAEARISAILGELYLETGLAFTVAESACRKGVMPGASLESYRGRYHVVLAAKI